MSRNINLSIIIPMYNVEKYIGECISSIAGQIESNIRAEVILVDDGSTDRTIEVAYEALEERSLDNFKLIKQKNNRQGAARNNGLKYAQGDYIWFVDADDRISKKSFKKLESAINKNFDVVDFGQADMIGGKLIRRFDREKHHNNILSGYQVLCLDSYTGVITHALFRRRFLLENELLQMEGVFHEDVEYAPRVYYLAKKVLILNYDLYFVRQNPTSVTRTFNPYRSFDLISVCESLYFFVQENVNKKETKRFYELISRALNSSLVNYPYMSKTVKLKYRSELKKNFYLLNSFLLSGRIKYIFEGIVFNVNLKLTLSLYSLMKMIRCSNH